MNIPRIIIKNIIYYRRLNFPLILGTAVVSTVVTGSLMLGDSIRNSLRVMMRERTGSIEWVLNAGNRFFDNSLADRLREKTNADVSPVIMLRAVASAHGGADRAWDARVLGIGSDFFAMGPSRGKKNAIAPGDALINVKTARRLNVREADVFTVRVRKPSAIPTDAPFSQGNEFVSLRLTVRKILKKEDFGDFSLNNNTEIPSNIFVSNAYLAEKMDHRNKSNLLLMSEPDTLIPPHEDINAAWRFEDSDIRIIDVPGQSLVEVRSGRVFLAPAITAPLLKKFPGAIPVFSYFVNAIRKGSSTTPYSIVSSRIHGLDDNEVIINSWLADDLHAREGDVIEFEYYVIDPKRRLQAKKEKFTVKSITAIRGWADDKTLMPDFPGLGDAGNCKDWRPGIPIDLNAIRDKDEDYWDAYRGTPKAFISFNKAQNIWSNQFGEMTGIRFSSRDKSAVVRALQNIVKPGISGIAVEQVSRIRERSVKGAVDFSGLFMGLSFFIVVSALILIALLFGFYLDTRSSEIGTLHAVGYTQSLIRRLFLSEGIAIAMIGSLMGTACAVVYNRLLLWLLATRWYDAVRITALYIHIDPATLALGWMLSVVFSSVSLYLCLRAIFQKNIAAMQKRTAGAEGSGPVPRVYRVLNAGIFAVLAIALFYCTVSGREYPLLLFMFFGMLLLGNSVFLAFMVFRASETIKNRTRVSLVSLGLGNISRMPGRSLGIISMIAIGVFMLIAISANRQNAAKDAGQRRSGTGGFGLFCTFAHPVNHDLNTRAGRNAYNLDEDRFKSTRFVQMRLREGDDASCLNINRTYAPRVLGVDEKEFSERGAFTFSKLYRDIDENTKNPWDILARELPDGKIPAIADQVVIQWGLGKKIGDTLTMLDESGKEIELLLVAGLANSVFQGYLIISEKYFLKHFPSVGGFRVLLTDRAAGKDNRDIKAGLERAFINHGIAVTPADERLAEFNSVQNTYLSIFLMLGGLGLMLGTLGLGILLLRNAAERKGELSLLRALGFTKGLIVKVIVSEYLFLLIPGIGIGVLAGILAVLPVITAPGGDIPYVFITSIIAGIAVFGAASIFLASAYSLKGNITAGLREE